MLPYPELLALLAKELSAQSPDDSLCAYIACQISAAAPAPLACAADLRAALSKSGNFFENGAEFTTEAFMPAFKAALAGLPDPACRIQIRRGPPPAPKKRAPSAARQSDRGCEPDYSPALGIPPGEFYAKSLAGRRFSPALSAVPFLDSSWRSRREDGPVTLFAKACAGRPGPGRGGAAAFLQALERQGCGADDIENRHRKPSEYLFEPIAAALAKSDRSLAAGFGLAQSVDRTSLHASLDALADYFEGLLDAGSRPIGAAFGITLFDCAFLAIYCAHPGSDRIKRICQGCRVAGTAPDAPKTVLHILAEGSGAALAFAEEMQLSALIAQSQTLRRPSSMRI